ncbi:NAD(P)-dependent dehydrogenase, short-chain alcohol dehydrogenase family [Hymenobacter daecheongensis DSM 21074]|uniref:NAD(P)-dependent dehydrogenase, short-chain alcohol dehydrogenase family n=2 Tax=Hymenobacter daecheongensis TaxID=496053 RepID=A0A1M6HTA0_9BACT|nr:NAD(P)-dependent dehydrogenase, short-chain alcohol dehydrogenase family [Hymenobacter daecheongensis DSM 21074]
MHGKTVLLTGASGGIGFVTARELARRGARMVLVCRDAGRAEAARGAILAEVPEANVDLLLCDLSLISNVRDLAAEVGRRYEKLDVLINNAGVMPGPLTITREGHELSWATNHLAVFALTNLLLPQLEAAGQGRVVTVASDGHWLGEIEPSQAARNDPEKYSAFAAYCDSKLANILFTNELAHRLDLTSITANCLHPGIVDTGLMAPGRTGLLKMAWSLGKPFMISPERGAQTSIFLASAPEVAHVSGRYFKHSKPARLLSSRAQNRAEASRLWRISAEETGIG